MTLTTTIGWSNGSIHSRLESAGSIPTRTRNPTTTYLTTALRSSSLDLTSAFATTGIVDAEERIVDEASEGD